MSYRLGALHGLGDAAGEISGIATLEFDLKRLVNEATSAWGSYAYEAGMFDSLMERARRGDLRQMTVPEVKQFTAGVIGRIGASLTKAKQLARLDAPTAADRDRIQSAQANLVRPAREMWDQAWAGLSTAQVVRGGTSGLGVLPLAAWAVIAIVAVALAGAGTYLWDANQRQERAMQDAERLCATYQPPCTPQQAADIRRGLQLGPFDAAAATIASQVGSAGETVILVTAAAAGGLVLVGGVYFWMKMRRRAEYY